MNPSVQLVRNKIYCSACLATDRELSALGRNLEELYRLVCPWDVSKKLKLCWECRAQIKNMKFFQAKSLRASYLIKSNNENFPSSLSALLSIAPLIEDSYPAIENVEEEIVQTCLSIEQEIKIEKENVEDENVYKVENEEEEEDYKVDIFEEPFDFVTVKKNEEKLDENILKELRISLQDVTVKKIKVKKVKVKKAPAQHAKRTKRYKLSHKKLENVAVTEPIEEEDISSWMEKEKNSPFYKKLKVKCDKCVSKIHNSLTLKDHNRKFHTKTKSMQFSCHICQQYFAQESNLSAHVQTHCFYYRCTLCDYKCYNKYNMRHHLKQHSRIVQCLECEASFNNTRKFFVHYRAAHKVFICAYCDKRHKAKHSLEGHIYRWHTTHKCDACNVSFCSYRSYCEHQKLKHRIERSEATYCVQCNMQFDTVRLFRRHINYSVAHSHERRDTPKRTSVKCPECENVYARKTNMMNHYRFVHLKQTKHYCRICVKWFLNSTRYKAHVRHYHDKKPKERSKICNICGRGFYDNRILTNHMRTHTGERPFECAQCDARFAQKVALDSHVRFIHHKDKRKPTPTTTTRHVYN